jgi:hypothetical protein
VPWRAVNFLRTYGLRTTLWKIRAHLNNALFDRRYGVRSDQWIAAADLTVVGDNQEHGANCQPIKPLAFKTAMDSFEIPRGGVFVDFGSGAGRAMMMAVLYGFQRVVGVEYAVEICPVAEKNLEVFRKRTGKEFVFRIANMDAGDYKVNDDECVFFLYNPFDVPVLERVLANIQQSHESKPRAIHLVYGHPLQRHVFDDDPFWVTVDESDAGGLEDFVYYRAR